MKTMDVSADLGEGFGVYDFGDDAALLEQITSANIACGFHAGDFAVMERTVKLALHAGVRVGAHPGYPDRFGFGRRTIPFSTPELSALVLYQIGALQALTRAQGGEVAHIKLHGALYHDVCYHVDTAQVLIKNVRRAAPELAWIAPFGSPFVALARAEQCVVEEEFFADRHYEDDGKLTPRTVADAVLDDSESIAKRVIVAWREGRVQTRSGTWRPVRADTVCLHGDRPGAVVRAAALRQAIEAAGIVLRAPHSLCDAGADG